MGRKLGLGQSAQRRPLAFIVQLIHGIHDRAGRSAHAVRAAIDEALVCKARGEKKVIAFSLSGHGHFDMMAYADYHQGKLQDYEYPAEAIAEAMRHLPQVAM